MKRPGLAILGLILLFSDLIIWNIGLIGLTNFKYEFYFYSMIANIILMFVGFLLISLFYSFTLAAGAVFLTFGINRIMVGVYYPPSSFHNPGAFYYISNYIDNGYPLIIIGILIIIISLFGKK